MSREGLDELIAENRILKGSEVNLAQTPTGMAVRAGAPLPDINSVEAFKQTLLRAKSVAFPASTTGIYLVEKLFPRLGIAEAVAGKSSTVGAAAVARGEVEIAIRPYSELVTVPGVTYVGPIPKDVQFVSVFSGAVVTGSTQVDGAKRLIAFMASEKAAAAIRKAGMEPAVSPAAQIKVLISGGFSAAYQGLLPQFEAASGTRVTTLRGASVGTGPNTIGAQVRRGQVADVVIMARDGLRDLVAEHRIVPGTDVDLADSFIGMVVRSGAAKPDITTVAAFKETLLRARSVAVSGSASGVYLTKTLFPRLGIANEMAGKTVSSGAAAVGRGEAEIGLQQVSEVLPIKGADFVGKIPADVQYVTVYAAAVVEGAKDADAAKRLIAFLSSAAAAPAIKKSGMEPPQHR
jgi:molybdate transport system substrate-binding protein